MVFCVGESPAGKKLFTFLAVPQYKGPHDAQFLLKHLQWHQPSTMIAKKLTALVVHFCSPTLKTKFKVSQTTDDMMISGPQP